MRATRQPVLTRHPLHWRPRELAGQRVLVVGLGTFGGGLGAARYLARQGARVTVTDLRPEEELAPAVAALRAHDVELVLGEHREADVERSDWIVASPAVPWSSPPLRAAARLQVPVESEITLASRLLPCPWLGVTGTNGKSTTAMLAARALETTGRRVILGGNLGGSLLDDVDALGESDLVVLELSSFQLEHLGEVGVGPPVALVTNVTPDHLDRHGSFDAYAAAKAAILVRARIAVLPAGDAVSRRFGEDFAGRVVWFGEREAGAPDLDYVLRPDGKLEGRVDGRAQEVDPSPFRLFGKHNKLNLLAAGAAAVQLGAGFEGAVRAAMSAGPIPCRLSLVGTVGGVRFVDDSVSTSAPAVVAAMRSFDGVIHLIAGGYDKKLDAAELLDEVLERGSFTYFYGQVGARLEAQLERRRGGRAPLRVPAPRTPRSGVFANLEEAFRAAARAAQPGEVVLYSPGHASYDQFRNFTERGLLFRSLVRDWGALNPGMRTGESALDPG